LRLELLRVVNLRNAKIVNAIDPIEQLIRVNLVDKALGLMKGVVAE